MFEDPDRVRYELLSWITPKEAPDEVQRLAGEIGSGDYEVYMHKIDAALDEAHSVFTKTGVSSMLKAGDVVVGVHNRRGDLVSASCGTYLHGPVAQLPVKFLIQRFLEGDSNVTVEPGDIFYTNEALTGGIHPEDQMAIMPIFHDGTLIAWATAALHQPETGAIEPGGMPETARTRYDEGMRLTPIKIAEDYEIRDDLMDMMKNFIMRAPQMQETDVHARCTTVDVIRKRIQELAAEAGGDFVRGLFQKAIDTAETGARNIVSSLNDGTYRSVAFFDNIGAEEALMKISLTVEKQGDEILFDFSGTSPEAGSYNSFAHAVPAYVASYLFPYVFYDLPVSTGAFTPFSFKIPDRSVLNANPEASVSQCVLTGTVILSVCHDAFSRMLYATHPEKVAVAPDTHEGGDGAYTVGVDRYGVQHANVGTFELNTKGGGARAHKDGVNALGFSYAPWGKSRNIEEMEDVGVSLTYAASHLPDSGGAGKYRGGNGTQLLNVIVSDHPASAGGGGKGNHIPNNTGLFGGYAEASLLKAYVRNTDILERLEAGEDVPTDVRELVSERAVDGDYVMTKLGGESQQFEKGDTLIGLTGGAGGLGDPLERDPEAVREDLAQGLTTEWTVENVYHVAIEDGKIDHEATERLREAERERRKRRGKPFEEFQAEWRTKQPPQDILEHYGDWPEAMVETTSVEEMLGD